MSQSKKMLINATQHEEIRVALVEGQKLYGLDIESAGQEQIKGSIFKGRITGIQPSLEAVFVEYGSEGQRNGFLPYREISPEYFAPFNGQHEDYKPDIKDILKEGQELIIQVKKEEDKRKGAASNAVTGCCHSASCLANSESSFGSNVIRPDCDFSAFSQQS